MASSTLDDGPSKREAVRTAAIGSVENGNARRHYGLSLAAVTATVIVGFLFRALFAQALGSIGMLFLVPVMAIAVYFGLRPALFTAFASVLAYISFFCRRFIRSISPIPTIGCPSRRCCSWR